MQFLLQQRSLGLKEGNAGRLSRLGESPVSGRERSSAPHGKPEGCAGGMRSHLSINDTSGLPHPITPTNNPQSITMNTTITYNAAEKPTAT